MHNYRIPEIAKQFTDYDMIITHTELPDFPDFRTRLLYAFLNKDHLQMNFSELYAFVTSLVQLGLDTHDLVPQTNIHKGKSAVRARQLKVLAGDYFSSRFYHILSQAGQIHMVQQLSTAICEVNRLKLNLYLQMKQAQLTAEDYIRQSVNIKIQLYLSFSHLFQKSGTSSWSETITSFTRCEVIIQELFHTQSLHNFRYSWAYWHVLQSGTKEEKKLLMGDEPEAGKLQSLLLKYNPASLLYQMLEDQLSVVSDIIRGLGTGKLVADLQQVKELLLNQVAKPEALKEV